MDNQDDLIVISVPVIIPEDRFNRISIKRKSRSPRKRPPLHVTPTSLLTGLCRCGTCNSSMHIMTGKSGTYRYLKCNRRNSISNSECSSPNVPLEAFERLILQSVIENVLTEERIRLILDDCKNRIDELDSKSHEEREQVLTLRKQLERKINNLYKLVEEDESGDIARLDTSLKTRIRGFQDDLDALNGRLSDLKIQVVVPPNLLSDISIADFSTKVRAALDDPKSEDARTFIRFFVDEIKVYVDEATISGANLGMVEAVLHSKSNTMPIVPSFMHKWRRGRDSNPR